MRRYHSLWGQAPVRPFARLGLRLGPRICGILSDVAVEILWKDEFLNEINKNYVW